MTRDHGVGSSGRNRLAAPLALTGSPARTAKEVVGWQWPADTHQSAAASVAWSCVIRAGWCHEMQSEHWPWSDAQKQDGGEKIRAARPFVWRRDGSSG